MSEQISPLPWRVNDDYGTIGTIDCADGRQVAQAQQAQPRDKDMQQVERRANAAFIVRAVNSHDALVESVKRLLGCMSLAGWENDHSAEFARAALAAAEAK